MNEPPKTELSMWERSTFVRMFRWLFSWRGIRRILIVTAWVATVIGLWYGEENWRGRHDWNKYREATEARGESLDFSTYVPKPVPDEQNFASTPYFKTFLENDGHLTLPNGLRSRAGNNISDNNLAKDRGHRHFTDLVAWQMAAVALQSGKLKREQKFETDITDLAARAAAAPVVLEDLKPDAEAFAELRGASGKEYARFPLIYDLENPWRDLVRLNVHLSRIKEIVQNLNLEACAELASGQNNQALLDVELMLTLADSVKTEPFVISFLVRASSFQITIQPVWEGLAEHRWTDAQLQELQTRFLSYDFLADVELPLNGEGAINVRSIEIVNRRGFSFAPPTQFMEDASRDEHGFYNSAAFKLGSRIFPSGWFYQEKLNYSTLLDARMKGVIDPTQKKVSPGKAMSNESELIGQIVGSPAKLILHHRLMSAMLLSGLPPVPLTVARAQVAADQAALACALERYRLANGQFPETLDALTPQFISHAPNDVITGQPYKYRRTEDGQFVLYSVGWNVKDDGGAPGKTLWDPANGDWVWSYPAK